MDKNIHIYAHVLDEIWIFLLINIVTNSVGTLLKQRNRVLHHFNPPSQWKACKAMASLGRATICAQKDKGIHAQA